MTAIFLFIAFILFVVAACITVPVWNRIVSAGLACLAIGLGAMKIVGLG